jgi:signal transduction histidine kinase
LRSDGTSVFLDNIVRTVDWFGTRAVQNTFVDVTARRIAENELREYQEHLADLVAQRTSALEETQQALVRAERLSTIGQLTATVSHELRNPLGTLKTSIETLRRELPDSGEQPVRIMDRIDRSIDRCTTIIQELLYFVQVRELDLQEVDVDAWTERIIHDFEIPGEIELHFQAGSAACVHADPARLEQCLTNVLHNACQGMLEVGHEGRLWVHTRVHAGRVEIRTSDSGPGVPVELRERIFDPLFSTRGFGIGLGLPLVRQIMEQHSGGVEVHDSEEGGACFVLWLPLARCEA